MPIPAHTHPRPRFGGANTGIVAGIAAGRSGAAGAAATASCTSERMRPLRIEDPPQLFTRPCELLAHRALAHAQQISDLQRREVVPVGEVHHGPLLRTQLGERAVRVDRRLVGRGRSRQCHREFTSLPSLVAASHRQRSVQHRPIQVGAAVFHRAPPRRPERSEHPIGHHVGRIGGPDQRGGVADQLIRMAPVQRDVVVHERHHHP
jgi:hypothetical protein